MHMSLCGIFNAHFTHHFLLNLLVQSLSIWQSQAYGQKHLSHAIPLNKKISQLEIHSNKVFVAEFDLYFHKNDY